MPREVWDPDKPSKAFTPREQPLSVKKEDPYKYMKSPLLNPETPFKLGRQSKGPIYTEPKATIKRNRPEGWYPGDPVGRQPKPKKPTVAPIIPDKDDGDDTVRCTGGQIPDGRGGCKDPPVQECGEGQVKDASGNCVDDGCGDGQTKVGGQCVPICGEGETRVDGVCKTVTNDCVPPCGEGKKCVNGNCVDDGGGNGGEPPSLDTIIKPDQIPMLQSLTNEMDLRNMLTNVLNKNNPLFKQARTRALQAMAGRGIVNSSMAEEAVMSAVMNVAMPIATRVIDDLQRVMAANVNASNAFKQALNQAYYQELITRVDAANTWNLNKMLQSQEWARAMLTAKTGAASAKDKGQFERYMDMLSGKTYGNI